MTDHPQSSPQHDLRTILTNISHAVGDIGRSVSELESSILDTVFESNGLDIDPAAIQKFDLIIQSTEEIRLVLERLANAPDIDGVVEDARVVAPIRLGALRHRVGASSTIDITVDIAAAKNSVSLF